MPVKTERKNKIANSHRSSVSFGEESSHVLKSINFTLFLLVVCALEVWIGFHYAVTITFGGKKI